MLNTTSHTHIVFSSSNDTYVINVNMRVRVHGRVVRRSKIRVEIGRQSSCWRIVQSLCSLLFFFNYVGINFLSLEVDETSCMTAWFGHYILIWIVLF